MHTINYRDHSIRFDDIGNSRFVVLDDIANVFADRGDDLIPLSHAIFTSNRTFMDDFQVIRLEMIEKLFPITEELSSLLTEAVPPAAVECAREGHHEMFEDFRMTLEEVTGFLTDSLCEFVTEGSSDRLVKDLGGILSYLEAIETTLYDNYC